MNHPLFSHGFRPFFLLAAAWATLAALAWVAMLRGAPLHPALPATVWHAHEMVWGFVVAVIAGFLLTAARNWTGLQTAVGGPLAALCALWVAGRLVVAFGGALPWGVVAAIDVAFLPALAFVVGRPIVAAKNWRNLPFPILLLVLATANLAVHAGAAGYGPEPMAPIRALGLDAVTLVIVIVAGRIIPAFTRNALPHAGVDPQGVVDASAVWAVGLLVALDALALGWPDAVRLAGIAAIGAAALNAARMWGWRSLATLPHPILWVLHLAYALLALALLLRGLATLTSAVPSSLATHVLTIGAIGLITLGMMSRVSLGHTGRPLIVARSVAVAYGLLATATVIRAAGVLLPAWLAISWDVSATLFAAAFLIFLVVYTPILVGPRAEA